MQPRGAFSEGSRALPELLGRMTPGCRGSSWMEGRLHPRLIDTFSHRLKDLGQEVEKLGAHSKCRSLNSDKLPLKLDVGRRNMMRVCE